MVTFYTILNLGHWKKENRVIAHDVVSYYGYLPALTIYGDITLNNPNDDYSKFDHNFFFLKTADSSNVYKTTMGMAILYSPFFALSHLYVQTTSWIPNGFSSPYKFALCFSSFFYCVLGLIFLRKFLRNYFNSQTVAITLLLITLGTNYYYYTTLAVGMPHIYLFASYL